MATIGEAREAKEALRAALAGHRGIAGVGIAPDDADGGDDPGVPVTRVDYVLQVNVETETVTADVPPEVHGVAVRIRVVGHVEIQASDDLDCDDPAGDGHDGDGHADDEPVDDEQDGDRFEDSGADKSR